MNKTTALGFIVLLGASACSSADENPFIAARAEAWRTSIADEIPAGTELAVAFAFFEKKGVLPRYVESEGTLYAPDNIEPEPKSLLPFGTGLIKSYHIRCRFSSSKKLVACSVEASTERLSSGKGPN